MEDRFKTAHQGDVFERRPGGSGMYQYQHRFLEMQDVSNEQLKDDVKHTIGSKDGLVNIGFSRNRKKLRVELSSDSTYRGRRTPIVAVVTKGRERAHAGDIPTVLHYIRLHAIRHDIDIPKSRYEEAETMLHKHLTPKKLSAEGVKAYPYRYAGGAAVTGGAIAGAYYYRHRNGKREKVRKPSKHMQRSMQP
jgi:hypothetical protein